MAEWGRIIKGGASAGVSAVTCIYAGEKLAHVDPKTSKPMVERKNLPWVSAGIGIAGGAFLGFGLKQMDMGIGWFGGGLGAAGIQMYENRSVEIGLNRATATATGTTPSLGSQILGSGVAGAPAALGTAAQSAGSAGPTAAAAGGGVIGLAAQQLAGQQESRPPQGLFRGTDGALYQRVA